MPDEKLDRTRTAWSPAVVVRECCWGGDAAAHAYSLDKAMKMYGRIRSLEAVLDML